jgi:hypothetical protein
MQHGAEVIVRCVLKIQMQIAAKQVVLSTSDRPLAKRQVVVVTKFAQMAPIKTKNATMMIAYPVAQGIIAMMERDTAIRIITIAVAIQRLRQWLDVHNVRC